MPHTLSITYDYLCPFARNANEAVLELLEGGSPHSVTFVAFSLTQNSAGPGDVPQWDLPSDQAGAGVLALYWSLAVRDDFADLFPAFHHAMFSARHDDARDISNPDVLRAVTESVGLDPDIVASVVGSGVPAKSLAQDHTTAVEQHGVFGVPTFIQGDQAVFVRFMERNQTDDVERVLDMLRWTNLNEFKRTVVDR